MVVCVHVGYVTVAGESDSYNFLLTCLLEEFQTTGGELSWYLGGACGRDRKGGILRMSHRPFIEFVVNRYGVESLYDLSASRSGWTSEGYTQSVCGKPVRPAVGSSIWISGMTRPEIAKTVRVNSTSSP